MTVNSGHRVISHCFPSGPVKGWCRPFCIFFGTFTIVMLLLVMSIDLKRRQYLPLDAVIWDFEGSSQYSQELVEIIRRDYIHLPNNETVDSDSSVVPSRHLLKIFKNKRNGVAIECGATSHSQGADWFVTNLDWRNLKIQANPIEIELLRIGAHGAFTSHTCLSLDTAASHTHIQTSTNYPNGTLTAVPCFPLYSMMKAFNATTLDLLILDDVKLPLRVLETLPTHDRVNIKAISFIEPNKKNSSICCSESTRGLMKKWGFTHAFSCPSKTAACYFMCSKLFCP
ncbi:hypothetical protein GE061_015727 [Apolygus lucorum]|uniref:Protein Star n=1 Tax=Apolygus lucorum TaxID=248454 RepID=A0A8S9XLQ5_APOLU|nr:hypothetical protein GE061_015727 [Apolygus lucorum]